MKVAESRPIAAPPPIAYSALAVRRYLSLWLTTLALLLWAAPRGLEALCADNAPHACCCCATELEAPQAKAHDRVERAPCCAARSGDAVSASATITAKDQAPQLASLAWRPIDRMSPPASSRVSIARRGPLVANGPPPYLRFGSLLI